MLLTFLFPSLMEAVVVSEIPEIHFILTQLIIQGHINTVISIMDADINNVEINTNNSSYSHSSQVVHSGSAYPYSVHLQVASGSCQN